MDLDPYNKDTELTCLLKIAQKIPPTDTSFLNISSDLSGMLGQCWNPEPSSRPNIVQCITTVNSSMTQAGSLQSAVQQSPDSPSRPGVMPVERGLWTASISPSRP